jgi:hypothetical protein
MNTEQDIATPPQAGDAVRERIERELFDCRDALETIAANRKDNDTQRGNERFYQGMVSALEFVLSLANRPSPAPAAVEAWQPISTAPKDGTEVLVYVPRRLGPLFAGASNTTGIQWWSRNLGDVQPSHWMPLPAPPISRDDHEGSQS